MNETVKDNDDDSYDDEDDNDVTGKVDVGKYVVGICCRT